METGVLAGYPCVDVKITLNDGAFHPVDSSAIAFELAAKVVPTNHAEGESSIDGTYHES